MAVKTTHDLRTTFNWIYWSNLFYVTISNRGNDRMEHYFIICRSQHFSKWKIYARRCVNGYWIGSLSVAVVRDAWTYGQCHSYQAIAICICHSFMHASMFGSEKSSTLLFWVVLNSAECYKLYYPHQWYVFVKQRRQLRK